MSYGMLSGEHWLCLCESLSERDHILILNFDFFSFFSFTQTVFFV